MEGAPYSVAYEGALRSLSQQEASLASLHSRAGTLISAIAISTSFLGAQALRDGDFTCWTVAALAAFTLAILCCMVVLWPRKDRWIFRIDPATLAQRMADQPKVELSGWYRGLSEEIGKALDTNDESLKSLYYWFEAASALLLLEILFWILDLWR